MNRTHDRDELTVNRLKEGWQVYTIGSHYHLQSPKGRRVRLSIAAFDRIRDRLACREKLGMKTYHLKK